MKKFNATFSCTQIQLKLETRIFTVFAVIELIVWQYFVDPTPKIEFKIQSIHVEIKSEYYPLQITTHISKVCSTNNLSN